MLLMPWLAVRFAPSDTGMAICFILFFAVNPLYSVGTGIFAGSNIKRLWVMTLLLPALFLLGTWMFFDFGETAFVWYACAYTVIGLISMLISSLLRKKRKDRS